MTPRLDPFAWLVSFDRARARQTAYVCLLFGPLLLAYFAYRMTQVPWELSRSSPIAIAIGGGCSPNGGVYPIQVRGTVYECGGGDTKCAHGDGARVAYDLERPRRCRLLRNVDRPSLYELSVLVLGLLLVSFAGAALSGEATGAEAFAGAEGKPKPRLGYVIWRALFGLSLLAFAVILLWQYSMVGPEF